MPDNLSSNKKLSDRVRPDVEAAPWVLDEIRKLERENAALRQALNVYEPPYGSREWMEAQLPP